MSNISQQSSQKSVRPIWLIMGALVFTLFGLMAGLGSSFVLSEPSDEPELPTLASLTLEQEVTVVPTALPAQRFDVSIEDDPSIGSSNATVTIIVFSDFACNFCGHFARNTLQPLIESYSETVRFVYRDYPITSPLSTLSAQAAECVADQGQFWAYHDRLFAEQAQLSETLLETVAQDIGVNMTQFDDCMADESYQAEVLADYQAGQALELSGAPAIFINGIRLQGAHPYDEIAEIIEQELE